MVGIDVTYTTVQMFIREASEEDYSFKNKIFQRLITVGGVFAMFPSSSFGISKVNVSLKIFAAISNRHNSGTKTAKEIIFFRKCWLHISPYTI